MIKRIDIPYYDITEKNWKLNIDDIEYYGTIDYIVNRFIDNKNSYKYKINNKIEEKESFEEILETVVTNYKDITFDNFEDCYSKQELKVIKELITKLTEKEKSEPVVVEEWTYMYEYEVLRLLRKEIKEYQKEEDIKAYKAKITYAKVLLALVLITLIGLVLFMIVSSLIGKEAIVMIMLIYIICCIITVSINQILYMLWYGKPYRKFLNKNKIAIITSRYNGVR